MLREDCVPGTRVMYVPRTREGVILRQVGENGQCLVKFVHDEVGRNGVLETAALFPCTLVKIEEDQDPNP